MIVSRDLGPASQLSSCTSVEAREAMLRPTGTEWNVRIIWRGFCEAECATGGSKPASQMYRILSLTCNVRLKLQSCRIMMRRSRFFNPPTYGLKRPPRATYHDLTSLLTDRLTTIPTVKTYGGARDRMTACLSLSNHRTYNPHARATNLRSYIPTIPRPAA